MIIYLYYRRKKMQIPDFLIKKINNEYNEEILFLQTVCYLDNSIQVQDGKEIYSEFVLQNNLDFICSGDDFTLTYDYLLEHHGYISKETFIEYLNRNKNPLHNEIIYIEGEKEKEQSCRDE